RSVIAFLPPAIKHAQIGDAVERSFLAAGAARLHRWPRGIEPYVDSLHQILRHVHVVVFKKRDSPAKPLIPAEVVNLSDELLTRFISGMGLAGKHDLYRSPPVMKQG